MEKPTKYTCPICGEENNEIDNTQEQTIYYTYNIETEDYDGPNRQRDDETYDSIWFCPDCGHELTREELELYQII